MAALHVTQSPRSLLFTPDYASQVRSRSFRSISDRECSLNDRLRFPVQMSAPEGPALYLAKQCGNRRPVLHHLFCCPVLRSGLGLLVVMQRLFQGPWPTHYSHQGHVVSLLFYGVVDRCATDVQKVRQDRKAASGMHLDQHGQGVCSELLDHMQELHAGPSLC